jgi:hypothetical protein
MAVTWGSIPRAAHGDVSIAPRLQHTADDIDGVYLMLGPLGAMSYMDRTRQSIFGGQLALLWVREAASPATLGLALGGLRYTTADRGRVWAELHAGIRVRGVHVGLGVGPLVEIDQVAPPRWGGQAGVWLFAGVIPYLRAGRLHSRGAFMEVGLQLMLPAAGW